MQRGPRTCLVMWGDSTGSLLAASKAAIAPLSGQTKSISCAICTACAALCYLLPLWNLPVVMCVAGAGAVILAGLCVGTRRQAEVLQGRMCEFPDAPAQLTHQERSDGTCAHKQTGVCTEGQRVTHHDGVCGDAAAAAGAGAGVPVWVAAVVGLGHIHQLALAAEGPGVVGAHDVVVLHPPLCRASRDVLSYTYSISLVHSSTSSSNIAPMLNEEARQPHNQSVTSLPPHNDAHVMTKRFA